MTGFFILEGSFIDPDQSQQVIGDIRSSAPELVLGTASWEQFDDPLGPARGRVYQLDPSDSGTLYFAADGLIIRDADAGDEYYTELFLGFAFTYQAYMNHVTGRIEFAPVTPGEALIPDQQLIDDYGLENAQSKPLISKIDINLPGARTVVDPFTGELREEYYDEYYLIIYARPTVDLPGKELNSRFIITDSDVDLLGQRDQAWGPEWLEILEGGFFTDSADTVDFNDLTDAQKQAIESAADPSQIIHAALGGDDVVTLPDAQNSDLTDDFTYDPLFTFRAGAGDDQVTGGDFDDTIEGEADKDILKGFDGKDKLIGGDDDDQLFGGDNNDDLYGSDPDKFTAGTEENTSDTLKGEAGLDKLFGSGGDDTLIGGLDEDEIRGGPGADTIFGGDEGNGNEDNAQDILEGGPGNDDIRFGDRDIMEFSGDGSDYTVEFLFLPSIVPIFAGVEIEGPDGKDTLTGGDLEAVLRFDNVDVTFQDLTTILQLESEVQKLTEEFKSRLEQLLQTQQVITKIEQLLQLTEDGISQTNYDQAIGLVRDIALIAVPDVVAKAPGFSNANTALKRVANGTLEFVDQNKELITVGKESVVFGASDQDLDDAALAAAALLTLFLAPPLGFALSVAVGTAAAANNFLELQQKLDGLKFELQAYKDQLEVFELREDALEKILSGLAQNMFDRVGEDNGWPCVRMQGDDIDCGKTLEERIKEVTGDLGASNFNFDAGGDVAGTNEGDTITDIAGAATVDTGAGDDVFTAFSDTGDVQLGEDDDTALLAGSFQSVDGGEGDNDSLVLQRQSTGLAGLIPEGAQVSGFENTTVVLDGNETVVAAQFGSGGDENLGGTGDSDLIAGGGGADAIAGGGGNDFVEGGAGDDNVAGGPGNDRIVGGTGNDILTGDSGFDRFVMQPGGGSDTVTDFEDGIDLLDLTGFASLNAKQAVENALAGSVILTFGDGTKVTLQGIELADFSLDDVLIANAVPTDIVGSEPFNVDENASAGTIVSSLSAVDSDQTDEHIFAIDYLRSGPGAENFEISGNVLRVSNAAGIDYETFSEHRLLIQADDGNGGVYEEQITVDVTNQPISDIRLVSGGSVLETAAPGTAVAVFEAHENPAEPNAQWTLIDDGGGRFVLDGNVLRVADNSSLDFETAPNLDIRLSAQDGASAPHEESFNIQILDYRNSVDVVRAYYETIYREQATAEVIEDYIGDETLVETLCSISQPVFSFIRIYQSVFARLPDSGGLDFWVGVFRRLELERGGQLEPGSDQYRAVLEEILSTWLESDEFKARFGSDSTDETFVFLLYRNILNRDPDDGGYQFWLAVLKGGLSREELIVIFSESDEFKDRTDGLIKDFLIEAAEISLENYPAYDIPGNDLYTGSLWNDDPLGARLTNQNIAEDAVPGTVVGTIIPADYDGREVFSLALADPSGTFSIVGRELVIAAGAQLDFETTPEYSLLLTITDKNGGEVQQSLDISVVDVFENAAPTDITSLSSLEVQENAAPGTVIATLQAVDADVGDQHVFSIDLAQSGPTASFFAIDGDDLVVSGTAVFDFEQAVQHQLTITADDQNGGLFSKLISVDVINLPISDIDIISGGTIDGAVADDDVVAAFAALENPVEPLAQFTLTDNAGGRFYLDGNQLRISPGAAQEIGPQREYQVTLEADDGSGNPYSESFAITTGITTAVPAFYRGLLQTPDNTGFVRSDSTADWVPGEADFWFIYLSSGESVTIQVERQENDFDPKMLVVQGIVDDPTSLSGLIATADDEIDRPLGPFGDPLFELVATDAGYYTVVLDQFLSGPDDGGDGLFEYDILIG